MGNTNYLEGMACPKCGSNEPFGIGCFVTVTMFDDGSKDMGDLYWDKCSDISCLECGHEGIVKRFTIQGE